MYLEINSSPSVSVCLYLHILLYLPINLFLYLPSYFSVSVYPPSLYSLPPVLQVVISITTQRVSIAAEELPDGGVPGSRRLLLTQLIDDVTFRRHSRCVWFSLPAPL